MDERTAVSIAAYDEHARAYQERLRRRRPLRDVSRFAALAPAGALVLDAGCGPASDLRALTDMGLKPVGVDLSFGALEEARLLLPKHPLVQAPLDRLPFRERAFRGLWLSAAFVHLPRSEWAPTLSYLLRFVARGPLYFSCVRGSADLEPVDDVVLGRVYRTDASEQEVESLLASQGLRDINVELRPDPLVDRKRPWVVAFARVLG